MVVVVSVWAGFVLSTRSLAGTGLTIADGALIRFATPALLLLPFAIARWREFKALRLRAALLICVGGGLPYFLLINAGGSITSAAWAGTLTVGAAPVFVGLIQRFAYQERIGRLSVVGLATIAIGISFLVVTQPAFAVMGTALLLAAGVLWALYTVGLREAATGALVSAALVSTSSAVVVAIALLTRAAPSRLATIPLESILPFLLVVGVGTGIIAAFGYGFAVKRIGAGSGAIIGSLTPALVALFAIPVLGELPSPITIVGVVVVTLGVMIGSADTGPPAARLVG